MASEDSDTVSGIYCHKCGYDLRGQVGTYRCPECGRGFDPADRKTFRARPPCGLLWRLAQWAGLLLCALLLLLAMCWGWLYWGWKNEQAVAKMRALVDKVEPLGGQELKNHFGSAGWVLDRARDVVCSPGTTDADSVHLMELKQVQKLHLRRTKVTDAGLVHLKELKELRGLYLVGTNVTDAGIVKLRAVLPGADICRFSFGGTFEVGRSPFGR